MATLTRVTRSSGYSAWGWILQAASGAGLLVLLSLHMVAQHFVAPGGVQDYHEVVAYLKNPVVLVIETAFAGFVLYHAFAGVRAILTDLGMPKAREQTLNRVLVVLGVAMWLYGLVLTLNVITR